MDAFLVLRCGMEGARTHGCVLQDWVRLWRLLGSSWHMDNSTGSPSTASKQERERCAWPPPHVAEHSPKGPVCTSYLGLAPPCMAQARASEPEINFPPPTSQPECNKHHTHFEEIIEYEGLQILIWVFKTQCTVYLLLSLLHAMQAAARRYL